MDDPPFEGVLAGELGHDGEDVVARAHHHPVECLAVRVRRTDLLDGHHPAARLLVVGGLFYVLDFVFEADVPG